MHNGFECSSVAPAGAWRTTVGRVTGADGVLLQQADVDKVVLRVFRSSGRTDDDGPLRSYDLATIDVIFDTPQTDAWWDTAVAGGDGYNFRHTLKVDDPTVDGSDQFVLQGGETYVLEYEIVTYAKGPAFAVHNARVAAILSR